MGGIVRIEDRNRQIVTIDDLDRSNDEGVLCGKELMTALVAARDFVKHAVRDKPVEYFAERGNRRQGLRPIPARVNDLHFGRSALVAKADGCRSPLGRKMPPANA